MMRSTGITLLVAMLASNSSPARAAAPDPALGTTPAPTVNPDAASPEAPAPDPQEDDASESADTTDDATDGAEDTDAPGDADVTDDAEPDDAIEADTDDTASPESAATAKPPAPVTTNGSSQDDGELDPQVPERLPPMLRAAWWTSFGAFALATAAGVVSGLAEREEDKAVRLAVRFDPTAPPYYANVQDQYESILRRGEAYETTAITLAAIAGATAIAGVTLFIIDARRDKRAQRSGRARIDFDAGPGGLGVRF